jgi:hypothetical protein
MREKFRYRAQVALGHGLDVGKQTILVHTVQIAVANPQQYLFGIE